MKFWKVLLNHELVRVMSARSEEELENKIVKVACKLYPNNEFVDYTYAEI